MKIKDITEIWNQALQDLDACPEINNSPNDRIDWKDLRYQGYDAVSINGVVYQYNKHGPFVVVAPDSKSDDQ